METVDTGTVVGLVIMALAVVIFIYRMSYSKTETTAEPVAEKFNIDQPPVVTKTEETMPAAKCGCGRSSTGYCVGLHLLSEDEWKKTQEVKTKTEEVAALEAVLNTSVAVPSETTKPAKPKKAKKIVDKTNVLDVKPKTSAAELSGLDKKALLAKAKELNVPVTARMTKEQLVQKLIKA